MQLTRTKWRYLILGGAALWAGLAASPVWSGASAERSLLRLASQDAGPDQELSERESVPAPAGPSATAAVSASPPADTAAESQGANQPQASRPQASTAAEPAGKAVDVGRDVVWPLIVLVVGIAIVLGAIIGMKVNAFLALITAAIVVSLLAQGELADKIVRVATVFGESAGKIGIVIALAAVIGKCMLDSGAADRIVRSFLRLFGQGKAPIALAGSGFFLAIPVFFDTVFYLLVPLARSLHRRTGVNYLLYVLAIAVGGAITHTLVPPTPGPLVVAATLDVDLGVMLVVGIAVALPAAVAGLFFSYVANRLMPIPMRQIGTEPEPRPLEDGELPPLWLSVLPVLLPVLLIVSNSALALLETTSTSPRWLVLLQGTVAVVGNPNLALLFSAVIAILTLFFQRHLSRADLSRVIESSLMSGGVIILITAGGGAFGGMLQAAQVGPAIAYLFSGSGAAGLMVLSLGFSLAALLKIAQGSSTVAMITGSAMLAGVATGGTLGFHPVYLATAIGAGSLFGSWMNDSGFWIFAKMSGLTETEALRSWTPALIVLAVSGFLVTLLLAIVLPYPPLTAPPTAGTLP